MDKNSKIYIAGHSGVVGSEIYKLLSNKQYKNIIIKSKKELDLTRQKSVESFFDSEKPDVVFLCAGKVGSVYANDNYRAEFIRENLMIEANIIHTSFLAGVKKLIFFGSGSMYPKNAGSPFKESSLLTGPLEFTNEPFALAKLTGMKMCESYNRQYGTDFITVIPSNVYGLNQNYEPLNSLVVPSLIRKFYLAKLNNAASVEVWGSGNAVRDFIDATTLADCVLFVLEKYTSNEPINIGSGTSLRIKDLAFLLKDISGYKGEIVFDTQLPEGMLEKLPDLSKLKSLGWKFPNNINQSLKDVFINYSGKY